MMNKLDSKTRLPPALMPHVLAILEVWHRLLVYESMQLGVSGLEITSTCTYIIPLVKSLAVASRFYSATTHQEQDKEETFCCAKLTPQDDGCYFRLFSKVVYPHAMAT
jgi:hypothetical protein